MRNLMKEHERSWSWRTILTLHLFGSFKFFLSVHEGFESTNMPCTLFPTHLDHEDHPRMGQCRYFMEFLWSSYGIPPFQSVLWWCFSLRRNHRIWIWRIQRVERWNIFDRCNGTCSVGRTLLWLYLDYQWLSLIHNIYIYIERERFWIFHQMFGCLDDSGLRTVVVSSWPANQLQAGKAISCHGCMELTEMIPMVFLTLRS